VTRRGYLDWLRGVAVLIMIEAHTLDAWTRPEERTHLYAWAMVIAGYGAPFFMFLAGIALSLAAGARRRRGASDAAIAAKARWRGWQIFLFAFLFRAQAWIVSGGSLRSLLKVDILNVMGVSMLVAAVLWQWGRTRARRAMLLLAVAVACTMATPLVRAAQVLDAWPVPLAAYFRPIPGRTMFTLFPWAGFLLVGAAVGLWLETTTTEREERKVTTLLGLCGLGAVTGGYLASLLPSIYAHSDYWTSSPTYFFVRLGILLLSIPVAWWWARLWPGWSPLQDFGRASLFVYWVHVELVYGVISWNLHRALSFQMAVAGFALFAVFMFLLVKAKDRIVDAWNRPAPMGGRRLASPDSA
jgi:uncharacterized membrane protein